MPQFPPPHCPVLGGVLAPRGLTESELLSSVACLIWVVMGAGWLITTLCMGSRRHGGVLVADRLSHRL